MNNATTGFEVWTDAGLAQVCETLEEAHEVADELHAEGARDIEIRGAR